MIYEQKYKKRVFNTHKSVCDTCPGSYHTISQYLCIYNNNNNLSNETFYYFSESYITFYQKKRNLSYTRFLVLSFNTLSKPLYLIAVTKPAGFEKVSWMIPLSTTTLKKQQSKQQIS